MRNVPIDAALAISPCSKALNRLSDGGYAVVEYLHGDEKCLYCLSIFDSNFTIAEEYFYVSAEELYVVFDKVDPVWIPITYDTVDSLLSDEVDIPFGLPATLEDEQRVADILAPYKGALS